MNKNQRCPYRYETCYKWVFDCGQSKLALHSKLNNLQVEPDITADFRGICRFRESCETSTSGASKCERTGGACTGAKKQEMPRRLISWWAKYQRLKLKPREAGLSINSVAGSYGKHEGRVQASSSSWSCYALMFASETTQRFNIDNEVRGGQTALHH
jgi:hypothetical protein